MPTDSPAVLFGERKPLFAAANVRDAELTRTEKTEKNEEAWNELIDKTLVEWGRDASVLEDDGFMPPDLDVINFACQVAMACRDAGCPPPTRIVPDGEGGISLEHVEGELSTSLNIYADRTVELLSFVDCRLRHRCRLVW